MGAEKPTRGSPRALRDIRESETDYPYVNHLLACVTKACVANHKMKGSDALVRMDKHLERSADQLWSMCSTAHFLRVMGLWMSERLSFGEKERLIEIEPHRMAMLPMAHLMLAM